MDASGTVLYSKFPKAKLAPASTVKLVTAMVALEMLRPDDVVKVSLNASRTKTIPPRLCPEEEMTVSDLLHLALMKSINSAAVALAEAAAGSEGDFSVLMNRKAEQIGAVNTLFANASGLPKGMQYSTASDLALIMKAALQYPLIREILAKKEYTVRTAAGRELALESSNDFLWEGRSGIIGKTGYTGNARHCFVAAIDTENGPLYTAVLGARSRAGLWRSTQTLAEIGMHPETAKVVERPIMTQSRKAAAHPGRNKPVAPAWEPDIAELQMSRLQGVFSQKTRNN
jgi:D-alanyl-D-alanine carboxypeptidase (penicillin-binding protein 5/6)